MYTTHAFINGSWRIYTCNGIAALEALQDVFARLGIQYRS